MRQYLDVGIGRVAALVAAVESGDCEEIAKEAHALKGASSTFGAARLASVCVALEQASRGGNLEQARSLVPQLEAVAADTRVALERDLQHSAAPAG